MAWYNNLPSKIFSRKTGIIAGIVVAVAAVATMVTRAFGSTPAAPEPQITPQPALAVAPEPELSGPADGYAPNQWRNRVQSARGGQPVQEAVNPKMGVAQADDLGSIQARQ